MEQRIINPVLFVGLNAKAKERYIDSFTPITEKMKFIAKVVCDTLGLEVIDIITANRKSHLVKARQMAMHLIRKYTSAQLVLIGDFFGGRDHSTVLYGLDTVQDLCDTDRGYRLQLKVIDERVTAALKHYEYI